MTDVACRDGPNAPRALRPTQVRAAATEKEERLLSGPLRKIGSSMTMIFRLRVGGTVAVDR